MNSILEPLNAQAQFQIGKPAEEDHFQHPILRASIQFEDISLNINRNQYSDLLDFLEYQDYLQTKSKYIKYHQILSDNPEEKMTRKRFEEDFLSFY